MEVSCIILAGGKSRRLGRNKAIERIGETSLLEKVISVLKQITNEVIIVTGEDTSSVDGLKDKNLKHVKDIFPEKGSLGGIYTGLVVSGSQYNFVVACDMPFLNIQLIRYMIETINDHGIVVPKLKDKGYEPLHAIYSKSCIPQIEQLLKTNHLSIKDLIPLVNVKEILDDEIELYDLEHLSFFNINTELDLARGKNIHVKEEDNTIDKR